MALLNLNDLEKVTGAGFGGSTDPTIKSVLQELQGLTKTVAAGFAAAGSVAVANMSAGSGDSLLSVLVESSGLGIVDITGSASIVANRVKIIDTSTANKKLVIDWYNRDGS